jgi:hypothetical protein
MEKELRNKKILDLHNYGESIRSIAKELGIGKTTVSEIITKALDKGEDVPPKEVIPVKLKGTEERFTNFSGYVRTDVNEYSNKETGEVVRVVFVKAKSKDEFGYFVKLNN